MGNALLGLFAAEFVNASHPHLPTRVVKAAVSAYVGPNTCAGVAKEVGAAPLLRWHRTVRLFQQFFFFSTELSCLKAANATKAGNSAS
jgi:large subunit ribosomal protein L44